MSSNKFCTNCGNKINPAAKFCNNCGNRVNNNSSSKKEKVLKNERTGKFKWINITLVLLFVGVIAIYFSTTKTKEEEVISGQPEIMDSYYYPPGNVTLKSISAVVQSNNVVISLNDVREYKFVSFSYESEKGLIPLLAYINEDGKVVTAIRMCEPCNSQSFHISGNELICDACGTTWKVNNLKAISGSCGKYPPDPIPSELVDDEIHIARSAIESWQRRV